MKAERRSTGTAQGCVLIQDTSLGPEAVYAILATTGRTAPETPAGKGLLLISQPDARQC